MITPPAIDRFFDEEIARAPALIDQVIGGLLDRLVQPDAGMAAADRLIAADLARALAARRQRLAADFSSSLRNIVQTHTATSSTGLPVATAGVRGLALVDESAVAADVETAHVAEAIGAAAEHELRELSAFLAALAGDTQVRLNHLLLGPDAMSRALWSAAKGLPSEKDLATRFMRLAARPLAQALRKSWAAACTRLEDAGITPAAYRTVILHGGSVRDAIGTARRSSQAAPQAIAQALERLERRLAVMPRGPAAPAPPSIDAGSHLSLGSDTRQAVVRPPTDDSTPRVEAVARIFDALQSDRRIDLDLRPAVSRLRESALRLAVVDRTLGASESHPLWSFVDRIAWQGRTLPAPPHRERVRTVQVVNGLVDQLAKEPQVDASRFAWALDRVLALEANRLERRIKQHAPQAAALAAVDLQLWAQKDARRAAAQADFDVTQLPTVPSELFDSVPPPIDALPPADAWLESLLPGQVARLLLQGRWIDTQLLWCSPRREIWLWADCASDDVWPIRRGALCMLFQGGLAGTMQPAQVAREVASELTERTGFATLV